MPLTKDEQEQARIAFFELGRCRLLQMGFLLLGVLMVPIILLVIFSSASETPVRIDDYHGLQASKAILPSSSGSFLGQLLGPLFFLFGAVVEYVRLKQRYAKNLAFVKELEKREPSEFPYGLEYEIDRERPELEGRSQQIDKRPLLWRLDAFLSRRPGSN